MSQELFSVVPVQAGGVKFSVFSFKVKSSGFQGTRGYSTEVEVMATDQKIYIQPTMIRREIKINKTY